MLTIARLAGRESVQEWPGPWAAALQSIHGKDWQQLARRAGDGVRALLASEGDLREALDLSRIGLLAGMPLTLAEFRVVGERLLVDAIEPLQAAARP